MKLNEIKMKMKTRYTVMLFMVILSGSLSAFEFSKYVVLELGNPKDAIALIAGMNDRGVVNLTPGTTDWSRPMNFPPGREYLEMVSRV